MKAINSLFTAAFAFAAAFMVMAAHVSCNTGAGASPSNGDEEAGFVLLDHDSIPFKAQVSSKALFQIRTSDSVTYFCDIVYPETSAHLYCTFREIDTVDVRQLAYEAERIVSFHSGIASSINRVSVQNSYGVSGFLYELSGEAATPYQMSLSDGATFFFNASLYFDDGSHSNDVPELVKAMRGDIDRLIYSFAVIR